MEINADDEEFAFYEGRTGVMLATKQQTEIRPKHF